MKLFNSKHNKGFTLVEIMISMAISLILLLGVTQIFSSNKRSSKISEGLARVQENARYALKKISTDMRRAGYVGCAGADNLNNHLDTTHPAYDPDLFDFSKGTAGWEFTKGLGTSATQPGQSYTITPASLSPGGADTQWQNNNTDGLPATLSGIVVPGNDIVVMKWAGDDLFNIQLQNTVTVKAAAIVTTTAHNIADGTVLIITDCSGGDVFQQVAAGNAKSLVRGVAKGAIAPGNIIPSAAPWGHTYPKGANLAVFLSRAYYIGQGVSGQPSLFSITYNQAAAAQFTQEIAEGIENMQVLYGVAATTNPGDVLPIKYVTAEQVVDHSRVVALKIGLIARSPGEVKSAASSRSLNLLGTTITTPSDRNLRFVFTTTVKLRNKGAK